MSQYRLVIGNKNYSSWSLRPWLAMKQAGIAFEEDFIALHTGDFKQRILEVSPSGRVPALIHGELTVWDSLAICEYLAERHPGMWPEDAAARAVARAASAEMHSGFGNLRTHMPMNIRKNYAGKGIAVGVEQDIARIFALWQDLRGRFGSSANAGGPFLCGKFSIADAMYAPVIMRFATYAVALPASLKPYFDAMLALPAMTEWMAAARRETETIPSEDCYG
jgi:glutathione S-transferase